MKIDRTKLKKSSSEVPPDCQALIDKLKRCNWDTLLEELSQIKTWNCGECELYHWIDVLNEFDHILEVSCEKVKENQWCLTCDGLHKAKLKRLLLNVLQFTALLIEHSFSQHFYNSVEHLTTLLSSSDMNVVLAVLNLLYVFSKRSNFIARLNAEKRQPLLSHLSYLAESWGGKENGFGLAECCQNLLITDYPSSASTLHFEFSDNKAHKKSFNTVITIHIDNVDKIIHKTPSDIMDDIVKNYAVPDDKQFQLFTQIRLAHSFSDYPKRILCVQARLQALSVLVYSNAVQDILNFLLYNGLIEELVDVLELQDSTLIEIKAAARRILTSIIRLDKNPKLSTITDTTGAVSYHGFLPVPDRNCIPAPTDYSQRSETSSCSAPPNYGTATAEDRDTGSAHSSPAATAFFIAFETEASTPRKKLGIRDSISKFAPTKSDAENRVSFQKNNKTEPSPKKLPIPDKANSSKSRTQFSANEKIDINEEIGKIADSTSFLIKRMLNGEMSPSDIPEEKPSKEKLHQNVQNDVNDDRSEAGTYIVETEQADCDVEEARKKIDEVFGVIQLSNSVLSSSYSSSTTSSSNKQIPRLNGGLKQNILKAPMNPKPRESTMQWNSVNKTYGRTRGQGPTPAASTESLNHSDTLPRSLQRTRKISDPPSTPDRTRRSKLATSPKSPGKAKTPSTLKSPGSLSNNLSAAPSNRETTNKEASVNSEEKRNCTKQIIVSDYSSQKFHHLDITRRRSTDSRSEGSKSPHTSTQWQKVPWNLSGSDLDLDRSKSENNSILSDTSTEPSSHSSHSGQSRPEQGPQMRLNRAFALRRARLEAESGKRGKENRTSTTTNQQKTIKKSSKLSSSTSTLRDESSSGTSSSKINFTRIAPTISKPFTGRQMVQCSDPLKRKNELKGGGHRRIESDPGKGIPVWKTDLRPVTSDHDEKGAVKTVPMDLSLDESRLQTFHRSVSCSIVNETDVPKSKVFHRGTLSHRDFPASLLKNLDSIMSGSQIMSSHNMDDYQCRSSNKEITALDSLVISAIHQLASKLWANSKELLERERKKCPKGSDTWLMIDEVLPQGPVTGTPEDGDFTKDLSSILKNLKRVEQGLDVLSSILENGRDPEPGVEEKTPLPQNFFVVNM